MCLSLAADSNDGFFTSRTAHSKLQQRHCLQPTCRLASNVGVRTQSAPCGSVLLCSDNSASKVQAHVKYVKHVEPPLGITRSAKHNVGRHKQVTHNTLLSHTC